MIETSTGATLRARVLILATDAYTGEALMLPRLHRRFFTMSSSLATTAPLSEPARSTIVSARHIVADMFALLNYFLILPDGRLLFGGAASLPLGRTRRAYTRFLSGACERCFRRSRP